MVVAVVLTVKRFNSVCRLKYATSEFLQGRTVPASYVLKQEGKGVQRGVVLHTKPCSGCGGAAGGRRDRGAHFFLVSRPVSFFLRQQQQQYGTTHHP